MTADHFEENEKTKKLVQAAGNMVPAIAEAMEKLGRSISFDHDTPV